MTPEQNRAMENDLQTGRKVVANQRVPLTAPSPPAVENKRFLSGDMRNYRHRKRGECAKFPRPDILAEISRLSMGAQ